MLRTHYRQPMDWTIKGLRESEHSLKNWCDSSDLEASSDEKLAPVVLDALCDDLNTPKAIAEMHALRNRAGHKSLAGTLTFFGLRGEEFSAWKAAHAPALTISENEIQKRIDARLAAKAARNFAESDRIRDELVAMGVVIKDAKDPKTGELTTAWEVAR